MASQLIKKSKNYDKELIDIISSETERISKIFNSISFVNSKIDLLEGKDENIHEILRYSIFRLKKLDKNIKILKTLILHYHVLKLIRMQ